MRHRPKRIDNDRCLLHCLAMLADLQPAVVKKIYDRMHGANYDLDIRRALQTGDHRMWQARMHKLVSRLRLKFRTVCSTSFLPELEGEGIIILCWLGTNTPLAHAVVFKGDTIYDPDRDTTLPFSSWWEAWRERRIFYYEVRFL